MPMGEVVWPPPVRLNLADHLEEAGQIGVNHPLSGNAVSWFTGTY